MSSTTADLPPTGDHYASLAKFFHWASAAIIIGNFVGGKFLTHVELPGDVVGAGFTVHKSLGITLIALAVARILWRVTHPFPAFPDGMAGWEKIAARSTHYIFYGAILAIPLAGWAISSQGSGPALQYFWLFGVPDLPVPMGEAWRARYVNAHSVLATLTMVLLFLHVGAALKHHYVNKDGVLMRMMFGSGTGRRSVPILIGVLVVIGLVYLAVMLTIGDDDDREAALAPPGIVDAGEATG